MDRDPNMRATLKVQSKNNIIEASLKRYLEGLQKQCEANVSQIDQDRLDVRDFLKQIRRCTTDDLPEAKHWLGNRTASGNRIPRTTRLTFRNQSAPTAAEQEEAARLAEQQRLEAAREYEMMGFRSTRGPKPELVQRSMALHKLFSRRNQYASAGRPAWDAWGMGGHNDQDTDLFDSASSAKGPLDSEPDRDENYRGTRLRRSDKNSKSSVHSRSEARKKHDCGRPGCQGHGGEADDEADEEFLKELLAGKHRKKRKKKEPLQERINNFFDRMEIVKEEEKRRMAMPSQMEMHRRWVTLTRGAKAALAESSDEEIDPDATHTI